MRLTVLLVGVLVMPLAVAQQSNDGATHDNWPSYGGTKKAWRYSALDQINTKNVRSLAPAWLFQTGEYSDALQSTPLVIDGTLYLSTNHAQVFALDAATGALKWHFKYPAPPLTGGNAVLTRPQNRGLAYGDGKIFLGTFDNHLLALDAKTGREIWNVAVDDSKQCGCLISGAPLVAKDKVIVGGTGGDGAHRGYLTAFNTKTGRLAWRFYTVPGPGQKGNETWKGDSWKHGGGATWMTGSYDPELNLLYWGTGNAASDFYSGDRIGKNYEGGDVNLYTASIVALDPDSGELRWYHQEVPNDMWDFDSTYEVILVDKVINGVKRKLAIHMNKSGLVFVLDRVTGAYVNAFSALQVQNWISGLGPKGQLLGRLQPRVGETVNICPSGLAGAKSWNQMAYSPQTGWIYTPMMEICNKITARRQEAIEGQFYAGGSGAVNLPKGRTTYSHLDAWDPLTGKRMWTYPYKYVLLSSVLATGGDLIFSGKPDGNFFALNARTGKELWHFQTGAGIRGSAVTYAVGGRQYVAIPTGWGSIVGDMTARLFDKNWRKGSTLVVFALPEDAQ